tara:strand:- start:22236 stop:22460 length:225 start_codon:yes stop_codon:yes gene_type:complete
MRAPAEPGHGAGVVGLMDARPKFEIDLNNFVDTERPGVHAVVCDCAECGFFGYVIKELADQTPRCPACGGPVNG